MVTDANGHEIKPGDVVVHKLAKHVLQWPLNPGDVFVMEDGVELLSHPFSGSREVERAVSTTCVKLHTVDQFMPVFLGEMLEVQTAEA